MREYKDCYVAFLDILGFKNLLKQRVPNICEKINSLFDQIQEEWITTVNTTGEYLTNPGEIKQKVMSDSICYYVESSVPNALAGLIATCNYFQIRLLRQDAPILVRGAIVRGNLYAEKDIVFGDGFVEAYLMEENTAKYPRIILTKALYNRSDTLNEHGKDYIKKFTFNDEDAFLTIDSLYLFYGLSHEKDDWKRFASYVSNRLDEETDASVKEKYLYLDRNISRVLKKFMKNKEESYFG